MDKIQRKYIKWILGLEKVTPNYIVEDECKLVNISLRGLKRAIKYEVRTKNSNKKALVECMNIMEEVEKEEKKGRWEEKRRRTLEWAGIKEGELKERREKGEIQEVVRWMGEKIIGKIEKERMEKLGKFKYNRDYIEIRGKEIPRYLEDRRKSKERSMIARFRVGNEMKARHWMKEEDRLCRVCREKEESMEHIFYECRETAGGNQMILNEEGKGVEQMRRILEKRKEKGRRRFTSSIGCRI